MAFFLIVPSVMVVSILLVHALANRLGLRIYYPTLAAVAVLSFTVIFITTFITPAVGKNFLLVLGAAILIASFLLTLANRFLIRKQQEDAKRFNEEVKAAYEAEVQKDSELSEKNSAPLEKFDWGESDDSFRMISRYNEPVEDTDDAQPNEKISDVTDDAQPNEEISDVADDAQPDEKVSDVADDAQPNEKVSDAPDDAQPNEEISDAPDDVQPDEKISDVTDDVQPNEKVSDVTDVQPKEEFTFSVTIDEPDEEISDDDEDLNEKNLSDEANDKFAEKTVVDVTEIEPVEKTSLPEDFPLEEVFKPLADIKPEEADKPIQLKEKIDPSEYFPLEEVFKPLSEIKPEEADKPFKHEKTKSTEFFPLQEAFEPLSLLNLDKLELLTRGRKISPTEDEEEEILDTLDEILDKAYSEREKGHLWQAIDLYNTALVRYRNDDYAPFIVIDLGNIYKEEALYSKAIKIYENALTLPAVKRNAEVKKEFVNNLAYLRVVRGILIKHQLMSTPFDKLPKEILQEIDTEFQKVHY